MRYHAPTGKLTVSLDDVRRGASQLRYALQQMRVTAGLPLEPYKREGALQPVDFAQKAILDAAADLGIDMGAHWGNELDLRDPG